jgi:hypothetical membrane protein
MLLSLRIFPAIFLAIFHIKIFLVFIVEPVTIFTILWHFRIPSWHRSPHNSLSDMDESWGER